MMGDSHNVRRLVFSIMKFLHQQRGNHSGETLEQIEVAQQFLESAYGFTLDDSEAQSRYGVERDLLDIFVASLDAGSGGSAANAAEDAETRKTKAEEKKTRGNELMKAEKFSDALAAYTEAIKFYDQNAVYFCNRAAAHSKLGDHQSAIDDCVNAIEIDPTYSKAYGRMGLAYSALGKHGEATKRYRRALELDPANESYKNNLKIAEEKSREESDGSSTTTGSSGYGSSGPNDFANSPFGNFANMFANQGGMPPGGMPPGGMPPGMPDMASLLANPQLMSMATQMMQNPEVQNLMTTMMTSAAGGAQPGGQAGMDNLMRAGQQLAQQLQSSNPELVDQLRQQMGGRGPGNEGEDDEADADGSGGGGGGGAGQ